MTTVLEGIQRECTVDPAIGGKPVGHGQAPTYEEVQIGARQEDSDEKHGRSGLS